MNPNLLLQLAVLVLIMVAYRLAKQWVKAWWKRRRRDRKPPNVKP
jgi:hypothetical protein